MAHIHTLCRSLILISLTAVTGTASAQAQYLVELVVFNNTDPSALGAETWRAEPGLPDTTTAVALNANNGVIVPMGTSSYRLSGVWQALRNSGQYRPLRHIAWRQPAASEANTPLVQLGDDPGDDVFGTVKLTRSRFLHLTLDLRVREGDGVYRISTRRKMSANELHYIDHPLIGILARVSRF